MGFFAAFAADGQDAVTTFFAESLDVGTAGFRDETHPRRGYRLALRGVHRRLTLTVPAASTYFVDLLFVPWLP